MLATYFITLTCRDVRPNLIWKGQKSTNLYQKAIETLFMDFAHCVYLWNVYLFIFHIHYLFIYVFLLFTKVQKCYIFWHCARLFVYLCISFIPKSRNVIFSGTVGLCISFISRSVMFSGTVHLARLSVFETEITMSWINTNTVNKYFFASSVFFFPFWNRCESRRQCPSKP